MSKTVLIDELPPGARELLCGGWEKQESVVLERNGEAIAAVVPMAEYLRWHAELKLSEASRRKTGVAAPGGPIDELDRATLDAYHRLVSKKFGVGLTPVEEIELERLGAELDAADAATPLEHDAREAHERRMALLDELTAQRKALQQP